LVDRHGPRDSDVFDGFVDVVFSSHKITLLRYVVADRTNNFRYTEKSRKIKRARFALSNCAVYELSGRIHQLHIQWHASNGMGSATQTWVERADDGFNPVKHAFL